MKLYKIISVTLIITHILSFGYVRDVLAVCAQSASYKITSTVLNDGGKQRSENKTKLLLHFDGLDGSQNIIDELGNQIGLFGNTHINTEQSKFSGSSVYFSGGKVELLEGGTASADSSYSVESVDQSQIVSNGINSFGYPGAAYNAQGFKTTLSGVCNKFTWQLRKIVGSPAGTVYAYIYDDNGGSPGNILAVSDTTIDVSLIPSTPTNYDFVFSNPAQITAGVQYHIVLKYLTGAWDNYLHTSTQSGNVYTNGTYKHSSDGVNWGDQGTDVYFKVYITSNNYYASNATDGSEETAWMSADATMPHWWKCDLGLNAGKIVEKVRIKPVLISGHAGIKDFKIQGSNDDSSWTDLYSGAALDNQDWQEFSFVNNSAYRYYRIFVINNCGGTNYAGFCAIEMPQGGNDYLSISDSPDWNFGTGDFAVDFWVRFNVIKPGGNVIISQKEAAGEEWYLSYYSDGANSGLVYNYQHDNSERVNFVRPATISAGEWYHVALTKNANAYRWFLNGIQLGDQLVNNYAYVDLEAPLYISSPESDSFNGWLDELRISKGSGRWTENFAVPLEPYEINADIGGQYRVKLDSVGEVFAGKSLSANYILESGYIPTLKSVPPVQNQIIPNQVWRENTAKNNTFDLDDYFSSPDNLAMNYAVTGNVNVNVAISQDTHVVSLSQAAGWSGTEKIKFTATDTDGNSITGNEVTLQVEGVDNPPVLDFIPDISVSEGQTVVITPRASDLDGDTIAYTFTAPLNGDGRWVTDYNDAGLYTVTVTATDSTNLSTSQILHINVRNINRPPVLNDLADITVNEGDLAVINPVATDSDGDAVTFYYSAPFDTTGKWLTGYSDSGSRVITVTASDRIDTVTKDVNVIVNNINRPPEAALTVNKYTASPNETLTITLSAVDPDGDAMTYSILRDSEVISSGALTDEKILTTAIGNIGDHTISATVTDSQGIAVSVSKGVDIVDPNVNIYAINPVMGDFNGDCLIDLGLHNRESGLWEVALSGGGIFTSAVDWLNGFGTTVDWTPTGGDFNGDGLTDVGIYNSTTGEFKPALSTGSGFSAQTAWLNFSSASSSWQLFTGNFNSDKYTDLGFYNKDTGEARVSLGTGVGFGAVSPWLDNSDTGYTAMGGDFNGDGLSDLCLFKKSSGEFKIYFSDSRAFLDGNVWITGFAANKDAILSDFNHDGLTDIGCWDGSGSWNYAISTGSCFVNKGAWLGYFGLSSDEIATTGDFNGDGVTDRAVFDREAQGISRWKVELNTLKPCDLMTEIDNGTGGKTNITYSYASKFDNGLLPFPVYVASAISVVDTKPADQPQEIYTQNFTFSGGYYDAVDREFRGFAKIKVSDPITNNYTETYFYQGKPGQDGALKGQIEKVLSFDGLGRQISQVVNTYDVRKAGPADNVLGFPALTSVETKVWEEDGSNLTTRSLMSYDNIGNLIEGIDEGDISKSGDEKSTSTVYSVAYEAGFNRPVEAILKDRDGNVISRKNFEYDSRGNLAVENVYIYDSLNLTTRNSITQYAYDSFGNLTSTTDALGRSVTTEYETTLYTYPQKVTNALGQYVSYVYDLKLGVVLSVTDINGVTSSSVYDSFGRIIQAKNGDNEIVAAYSYPDFNTKITTNALGLAKTEYVDGLGRKYKTVSSGEDGAAARAVSSEVYFNIRGLVDRESVAHYVDESESQISYIRYEYDLRGRTKKTISDFPGTLKDAESSINYINPLYIETIDPEGNRMGTLKDIFGNVVEVTEFTQGGVHKTAYEYDIQNNLVKVTDAQGNISQIWYDSVGRKLKMDDPDMGVWTYEYDLIGNLTRQTDAKGQILEFQYDVLNRLVNKSVNSQIIASYQYDDATKENCLGRLSKVTDQSGSTEFFYDKFGREIKSVKTVGSIPYTVERSYDILDRLLTLKYPDGAVINYSYDSNSGLLEKIYSGSGMSAINYASDISYNAKGQIKAIQYGNNTRTDYTYGQDLRLSRILTQGSTNLQDLNYQFDKNGNITTLTDNLRNNIRTYNYDELGRLTQANNLPSPSGGYTNFNYQYDSIGNMVYKSDVGIMTYGANAGPHAVTSAGGYSYSYDANGNMVTGKNKSLEYDAENRIIKIIQPNATSIFTYDGDGGRVKQSVTHGQEVTDTTYIGSLFEIHSSGSQEETVKHIFAGSQKVCDIKTAAGIQTAVDYYHSDHLGSSSIVTDQNGQQISRYEYTPYGSIAVAEGADATPYKFTGKELDSTGLYFYGARYYDPELGRFVTADTIVQSPYNPQTLNRYSYCNNNSLNYVDPSGHFWWIAAIIGAILGAVSSAVNGQPIWQGMLLGAAGGILTGGGAEIFGFWGAVAGGMLAGAGSSAATGGNIGFGALAGGLGAALGYGLGSWAGSENFWGGLGAASLSGALSGGIGAELQGGSFGEGAWMGAAYGTAGYLGSQAFNYGINKSDSERAEELELQRQQALSVDGGKIEAMASVENQEIVEIYRRGLSSGPDRGPRGQEVHPYMRKGNTFYELDTKEDLSGVTRIDIRSGALTDMSIATQIHASNNPQPFRIVSVYTDKFSKAIQSYGAEKNGQRYFIGSYYRDCRNFPYSTIRESRVK